MTQHPTDVSTSRAEEQLRNSAEQRKVQAALVVAQQLPAEQEQECSAARDGADALALVQRPSARPNARSPKEDLFLWLKSVCAAQRQLATHLTSSQAGVVAFLLHHSLRSALAAERRHFLLEGPPAPINGSGTGHYAAAAATARGAHPLRGLPPLPPPPSVGSHSRGISPMGSGSLPAGVSACPGVREGGSGAGLEAAAEEDEEDDGQPVRVLLTAASTTTPTVTISPAVSPRVALQPHTSAPLAVPVAGSPLASGKDAAAAGGAVLVVDVGAARHASPLPPSSKRGTTSSGVSKGGSGACLSPRRVWPGHWHHGGAAERAERYMPDCIRMGVWTSVGQRSSMEDFAFAMPLTCPENVPSFAFRHGACFGVFDGHGGHEVAQSLAEHVPDQIQGSIYHIAAEGAQQMGEILLDHERRLKRDPGMWSPSSSTSSLPATAAAAAAAAATSGTAASTPAGTAPPRTLAVHSPSPSTSSLSAAASTCFHSSGASFGKRSVGAVGAGGGGLGSRLGAAGPHSSGAWPLQQPQQRAATASPAAGGAGMRRLHTSALSLPALHDASGSTTLHDASGSTTLHTHSSGDALLLKFAPPPPPLLLAPPRHHGVTIEELPVLEAGAGLGPAGAAASGACMSCPARTSHVLVLDAPLDGNGATSAAGTVIAVASPSAVAVNGGSGPGLGGHRLSAPGAGADAGTPRHGSAVAGVAGVDVLPPMPHVHVLPPHVRSQSDLGLGGWNAVGHAVVAATVSVSLPSPAPPHLWAQQQQLLLQSSKQQALQKRLAQSEGGIQGVPAGPAAVGLLAPALGPAVQPNAPQQQPGLVPGPAPASPADPLDVPAPGPQPSADNRPPICSPLLGDCDGDSWAAGAREGAGTGPAATAAAGAPPKPLVQVPDEEASDGTATTLRQALVCEVLEPEDEDGQVEGGMLDDEAAEEEEARRGLDEWEVAMHGRDPGSTALVATILDGCMHVANVGDCRLIVAELDDTTGRVLPRVVTNDHVPSLHKGEAARLAALRVPVSDDGYVGAGGGFLQVSRSIGDFSTKTQLGEKVILSEPELHTYLLTPHSLFTVAASDGITCAMSDETIVNQVCRFLNEGGSTGLGNDPSHAAEQLVRYAIDSANSSDNASAVIVSLKLTKPPMPARPRRFGLGARGLSNTSVGSGPSAAAAPPPLVT